MELDDLLKEAKQYICGDDDVWRTKLAKFGDLPLLVDSEEFERATDVNNILADYAAWEAGRPFCISVFGPPGSGKSTLVKSILKEQSQHYSKLIEVNMAEVLTDDGCPIDFHLDGKIPTIFLDEFDTSIGRNKLAWLKRFLPMMQDGRFNTPAGVKEIKRALLIFAGGTAHTFDEFVDQNRDDIESYKALKVPDFISRLHPFINVSGINGHKVDRLMRRALAIRFQLSKRGMKQVNVDDDLLRKLLTVTHFTHNQRSLQSLIEMSLLSGKSIFDRSCLPPQKLMQAHVSRGPLAKCSICLSTWQGDSSVHSFALELSEVLLSDGATIAFGGDLEMATTGGPGMLKQVIDKAKGMEEGLIGRDQLPAVINYLAYPSNLRPQVASAIKDVQEQSGNFVHFVKDPTLSTFELNVISGAGRHFDREGYFESPKNDATRIAWAISLFRMRLRMIQDVEGLVVFGGKGEEVGLDPNKPVWGRCSGIAEEIFLALNYGKPVYILRNGAGALVGHLLGLGARRWTKPLLAKQSEEFVTKISDYAECFRLPGSDDAIVTQSQLLTELSKFSIDGPRWVYNGLTRDENIELFNLEPFSKDKAVAEAHIDLAISYITKGLRRVIPPRLT